MATTKSDIKRWLNKGIKSKSTHVIIVCDCFSYEDYPVYVNEDDNIQDVMKKFDNQNMQQVVEVYNLSLDIDEQLGQHRTFNI